MKSEETTFRFKVEVVLKNGVLDPQGEAIKQSININNLGHLNSHSIDQYDNRNIYQYENNFIDNIFVFNARIFHRNMVIHIGSGDWEGGWKNERYRILT